MYGHESRLSRIKELQSSHPVGTWNRTRQTGHRRLDHLSYSLGSDALCDVRLASDRSELVACSLLGQASMGRVEIPRFRLQSSIDCRTSRSLDSDSCQETEGDGSGLWRESSTPAPETHGREDQKSSISAAKCERKLIS